MMHSTRLGFVNAVHFFAGSEIRRSAVNEGKVFQMARDSNFDDTGHA